MATKFFGLADGHAYLFTPPTIEYFTDNDTLLESESGKVCTNKGATKDITITLPSSASVGTTFYFNSFSGYSFMIQAPIGDAIWHGLGTNYYGTELDTSEIGNSVQLLKIDTNDWIVLSHYGVDATKGWKESVATISTTLLFFCGGKVGGTPTLSNVIDYIDAEIQGQNAVDRGDMPTADMWPASVRTPTYGFLSGRGHNGAQPDISYLNLRQTTTNSFDRGDLSVARLGAIGISDVRYGFFCGGGSAFSAGSPSNVIDYIDGNTTIGDALDKGDLTVARGFSGSCEDTNYGYIAGGFTTFQTAASNVIDYVSLVTGASNAIDRGDLTVARGSLGGCSASSYGFFFGGYIGSGTTVQNEIDYIDLSTQTGNASDRGDLITGAHDCSGGSGSSLGFCGGGANYNYATSYGIQGFDNTIVTGSCVNIGSLTVARYSCGAVGGKVIS